jgi:hypothetical protein
MMHLRPYDTARPTVYEDMNIRAVHRRWHERFKNYDKYLDHLAAFSSPGANPIWGEGWHFVTWDANYVILDRLFQIDDEVILIIYRAHF